jgi:hypothetical protein
MASTNSNNQPVAGHVRPSQIIWSYGPGALIDLQNISVIALGLQEWEKLPNWSQHFESIREPRLLGQVRRELGHQVGELRVPPIASDVYGTTTADPEGMPVSLFPRYYRCRACNALGTIDQGSSFDLKGSNPNNLRVEHVSCPKSKKNSSRAVPARFLVTCEHGHLSDFPWREFVHDGPTSCRQPLSFFEVGGSLQTENLRVSCACNPQKTKSMAEAFRQGALKNLVCQGRHPHFGRQTIKSSCDGKLKPILLGATNVWFSKVLSALSLPTLTAPLMPADKVTLAIITCADSLADDKDDFTDIEEFERIVQKKKRYESLRPESIGASIDEIWEVVQSFYDPCNCEVSKFEELRKNEKSEVPESTNIKLPEWRALTSKQLPFRERTFEAEETECPSPFANKLERVVLVRRLREVRALVGFTRLQAEDNMVEAPDYAPEVVPLTPEPPHWVPAIEVRGEGIFIRFNEEALIAWESRPKVRKREETLHKAYVDWRTARNRSPEGFPGIRYVLLHTFAHAMIRELSLACGYSAASIRERIYASSASEPEPMAGVLLYTASSDSDGTLGGLVDLGKPENLNTLLTEGIKAMRICSSDPLCSEYDPTVADAASLDVHLAACHACNYVSETSCEIGNILLDRALLTETLIGSDCAFFA